MNINKSRTINDKIPYKEFSVTLELNKDFRRRDVEVNLYGLEIKANVLQQIAIDEGFDICVQCKRLLNIEQKFVDATFVRYL